jgi:hypothetical protein
MPTMNGRVLYRMLVTISEINSHTDLWEMFMKYDDETGSKP